MNQAADTRDTIFALSSGALPAAIAVIRISGPGAAFALQSLAGRLPDKRRAVSAPLRNQAGVLLDRALILWLPGPGTATGEDSAELHLHGSRAVVAAVLDELAALPELRLAEPGEFTRRAFMNGKLDLDQVEGLADLLTAQTEAQRRQALRLAEGGLGRLIAGWQVRLLAIAARVEAAIEFGDSEDDVDPLDASAHAAIQDLATDMEQALAQPPAERLRDGIRIVVAGPPNAGKSSLINHLASREAAIASSVAGTTRDVIEVPTEIAGRPVLLIDSAGLREARGTVERIGIERAKAALETADLVLWLGEQDKAPPRSLLIWNKVDLVRRRRVPAGADLAISMVTGEGLDRLAQRLRQAVGELSPDPDGIALNVRHRGFVRQATTDLWEARALNDPLLIAEHLRSVRIALDQISGRSGVEDMLDALFGRFCVGK